MGKKKNKGKKLQLQNMNMAQLQEGLDMIHRHPLFGAGCFCACQFKGDVLGKQTYATVSSSGVISLNENMHLSPRQWAYVIAHCKLHLVFGHFDSDKLPGYDSIDAYGHRVHKPEFQPLLWNFACDLYVDRFLLDIKFGEPIHDSIDSVCHKALDSERSIYTDLLEHGVDGTKNSFGTAAVGALDMIGLNRPLTYDEKNGEQNLFSIRFSRAVTSTVSRTVAEVSGHFFSDGRYLSNAQRASKWFINHYPLLGGVAAHFHLIEDSRVCIKNEIQIAAVDVVRGELYVNPSARLTYDELIFVMAHEFLHAGLMHHVRCQGRNSYLWNIACDFVINEWLQEMQIGMMPVNGALYDPSLKGMSAESVYDLIVTDMRKYEKLSTFRGYHRGDVIGTSHPIQHDGMSLDEFCRSALCQGLEYHMERAVRGTVPSGLVEEIRALSMPAIPWEVELAVWFDQYFQPIEKHRTYARPSRRQASTPDIPRASYHNIEELTDNRTFGVIIDTSGSMDAATIGKALGSAVSYATAHEVRYIRVVFYDAAAYDIGYVTPEELADRVRVKGRGGTILQPAADLLEQAEDFPKDGPILIITDGQIENYLTIRHKHAFLLFHTNGDLFYFD